MNPEIVATIVFATALCGGIGFVLWRNYDRASLGPERRRMKRVRATPVSDVGSGEFRVTGRVRAEEETTSPSGRRCVFYAATAQHWFRTSREGAIQEGWRTFAERSDCVPFTVEDETGRVSVDAQGARAILEEIEGPKRALGELSASEAALFAELGTGAEKWTVRIIEKVVVVDQVLTVVGHGDGDSVRLGSREGAPMLLADESSGLVSRGSSPRAAG